MEAMFLVKVGRFQGHSGVGGPVCVQHCLNYPPRISASSRVQVSDRERAYKYRIP